MHAPAFCGGKVCGGAGVSSGDRQEAKREQRAAQNWMQPAPTPRDLLPQGTATQIASPAGGQLSQREPFGDYFIAKS